MNLKNYRKLLIKKYQIPNNCNLTIKQGTIVKENFKSNIKSNSQSDPFKIRQLVHNDINDEISKIYKLINTSSEEMCDLLQFREFESDFYTENNQTFQIQMELIAEDFFENLSNSISTLITKSYQRFLFRLNEDSNNILENFEAFSNKILPQKEIYDKIYLWIENLKK